MILEQIGSAIADICLTTDFVGLPFWKEPDLLCRLQSCGVDRRAAAERLAGRQKSAFDIVIGSLILLVLSPLLAFMAWQFVSIARARSYSGSHVSVSTIASLSVTNFARCIMG